MKKLAEYQVSLKAILKNSKGEVLLLEKLPDAWENYGKYDFPGGRIDDDEFEVPCLNILKREIKEELGDIKVELNINPVGIGRHRNSVDTVFYVAFEGVILDEKVIISDEHLGYKFVKLEEIVLEDYFKSGMLEVAKMYLGK